MAPPRVSLRAVGARRRGAGPSDQSLPNPRGGSIAWSSARSSSQIACSTAASALSCRLIGSASSQTAYCACASVSSATASCQRRARPRRSVGRRERMTGAAEARAAGWRARRSASVIGLSPIDLPGMVPLRSVTSRNRGRAVRFGIIPRMGYGGCPRSGCRADVACCASAGSCRRSFRGCEHGA
jgi:hypothetical protein